MEPTVPIEVVKTLVTAALEEPASTTAGEQNDELPPRFFWAKLFLNYAFRFSTLACGFVIVWMVYGTPRLIPIGGDSQAQARVEAERSRRVTELDHKLQELMTDLQRVSGALESERNTYKNVEAAYEALLKENQQKSTKLDAQAQETASLKAKIASLEKDQKRLMAEFVKSLMAAGATPTVPSYAPPPNRPALPPELEKLSPDLSKEGEKPRCLLMLKGYGLLCNFTSPSQQQ